MSEAEILKQIDAISRDLRQVADRLEKTYPTKRFFWFVTALVIVTVVAFSLSIHAVM